MVMRFVRRTVGFAAGVAAGAAAGAGVAYLTAPRSGDDLRKEGQELIDSAIHAGDRARIDREAELRDKFRAQVGHRDALTHQSDATVAPPESTPPAVPFPS
jgi:gas vesicle protein